MSAVLKHLRTCWLTPGRTYDIDEWVDHAVKFEDACELAANHIEDLEEIIAQREQRIADLELLFEPFLKHFLKEQDDKPA